MKEYLALYYRLSLRDGDKKEEDVSNSIENQKKLLHSYVHSNKEFTGYEIIEFTDDGYSGTNFDRPDVSRMLDMVKAGQIKTVIVKDLSRFGRNYIEVGTYLETVFPFLHVRFISVLDHFDSKYQTAVGDIGLGFKNIRCDYYSKWLSKRIKQTKRFRAKKGVILMPPFFGYKKDKASGQLVIDEPAAKVVRFIFQERLAGKEMVEITKQLNAMGTFTPSIRGQQLRGTPEEKIKKNVWYTSAIREMLSNRQYTGCSIFGKTQSINYQSVKCSEENWTVSENCHEAIISEDLFEAVQKTLTKRDTTRKRPQDDFDALFVGKVICGNCGKSFRKRVDGTYFCKSREYISTENRCPNIRLREFELRSLVLRSMKYQLGLIEQEHSDNPDCSSMINAIKNNEDQQKDIDTEVIKLYERFSNGVMKKEEYLRQRENMESKRDFLRDESKRLYNKMDEAVQQHDIYQTLQRYSQIDSFDMSAEMVAELIDSIVVYGKDRIEIVWKYADIYSEMTGGMTK